MQAHILSMIPLANPDEAVAAEDISFTQIKEKQEFDTRQYEAVTPEYTTKITLSVDKNFVLQCICTCPHFKKDHPCRHILSLCSKITSPAIAYREQFSSRLQSKQILENISEHSLRHFLIGYRKQNSEFDVLLKLLFQHDISSEMMPKQTFKLLEKLGRQYVNKLHIKNQQKAFQLHLENFLETSRDLLLQENMIGSTSNLFGFFEYTLKYNRQLVEAKFFIQVYTFFLQLLTSLLEKTLPPELKEYIKSQLLGLLFEYAYTPTSERDVLEILHECGYINSEEYHYVISSNIKNTTKEKQWLRRYFDQYKSMKNQLPLGKLHLSNDQKKDISEVLCELGIVPLSLLFDLKQNISAFSKADLTNLIEHTKSYTKGFYILEYMQQYDTTHYIGWLKEHTRTEALQQLLEAYDLRYGLPTLIELLKSEKKAYDQLPIEEQIALLGEMNEKDREKILESIKAYYQQYTAHHFGTHANEHLTKLGHRMGRVNHFQKHQEFLEDLKRTFPNRKNLHLIL